MDNNAEDKWQFWIDRGGTFTDIVAKTPEGIIKTHKLLSDNPEHYQDASIQGIRDLLGLDQQQAIPAERIDSVKMGTTVATNALLERKGEPTLLAITKGFKDALRIGYQNRPRLFVRHIVLPEMLYQQVLEIPERYDAQGEELLPVAVDETQQGLQRAYEQGLRAIAIVLMHGYRCHEHEKIVAQLAREVGFTQISVSHQVSPLMKLVSRGDTTLVDAYLSPILRRYIDQVAAELGDVRLFFMQSNGGLAKAEAFHGKDSILSGPAAGVVGAVRTSQMAGYEKIISFDMGGTSTDVAHYCGEFERAFETYVAGVRLRAPMMHIHTIAAGGGSILHFEQGRYRVGPDSAGANPGPAAYRRGGPLTVTDSQIMLGRIQAKFFPKVFGPNADKPLDLDGVKEKFSQLTQQIQQQTGDRRSAEEVAEGFLHIAVNNMANAIKKISVQRGYDVTEYTLCCFGGAGGQHACRVADVLGIKTITIHPLAGVLSAYGMGLADVRLLKEQAVEKPLTKELIQTLKQQLQKLQQQGQQELQQQGLNDPMRALYQVRLRYEGTDVPLPVAFTGAEQMLAAFAASYLQHYGFVMQGRAVIVEAIAVEIVMAEHISLEKTKNVSVEIHADLLAEVEMYSSGIWQATPVYDRTQLGLGQKIAGPAILVDATATTIVEPGWQAQVKNSNHLLLQQIAQQQDYNKVATEVDPVMLEVFNNLFMSIAEQMGTALANTAYSVNIKERLDFSCAIFDQQGNLVANAQHMPVHLGSMSESVQVIIKERHGTMKQGDVYMLNNPYNGGTHLPDVTVITPVFQNHVSQPLFYVASRAHQADIGGITPGSVPPTSTNIHQEGILIDNFKLVDQGKFCEQELRELLTSDPWPVRNLQQSLGDLTAQIAANQKGVQEINKMVQHFGLDVVLSYMQHVQDNAEACVRKLLTKLKDGHFSYAMDNGGHVQVKVTINQQQQTACIDFTGTSPQQANNFNAPTAVVRAAIIYVLRTLIEQDIPMNQGFLKPINIIIPEDCILNPKYPAAVVAGNVETSQCIVDALYAALGVMAASQGTMNNFTFGNEKYQYYETICGGSGAGPDFAGTDAVHTHMTNSLMTDPEVLEWRFPVLLEEFSIRQNSGGQGKWQGGNGVKRKLKFLQPMTAGIISNHRKIPPYGLAGGAAGALGENALKHTNGKIDKLESTAIAAMKKEESFIIKTPGGGGYGEAEEEQ